MAYEPAFKIRSTIKHELKGYTIKKGGLISAGGAMLLLLGALSLPRTWAPWIFLLAIIFIVIGLYPYRQLCRLELKPHLLTVEGGLLHFFRSGKSLFKIPIETIDHLAYVEKDHLYGIALYLKRPIENKIIVTDNRFQFEAFATDSATRFEGCDLFLPYFSRTAHQELRTSLHNPNQEIF